MTVIMEHHANGTRYIASDFQEQIKVDKLLRGRFFYATADAYIKGFNGQPKLLKGTKVYLYDNATKILPFGLAKDARNLLLASGISVEVKNYTKKYVVTPASGLEYTGGLTPYHYQNDAVQTALDARYGMIHVPTAGGKTLILSKIIEAVSCKKTVVVTDGRTLVTQIANKLKADFPNAEVLQWGNGKKETCPATDKPVIIVSTYQSFHNQSAEDYILDTDLVIIDECHLVAATTFSSVAKAIPMPTYRIGLSATPFRENGDEILLKAYLGDTIFSIDEEVLLKGGFITQPVIGTINLNKLSQNELKSFLKGRKTLIITERIASQDYLLDKFPFLDAINGNKSYTKRLDAFKLATEDCLLATGVLDTGVDIPSIDTIIHYEPFDSVTKIQQRNGRNLRLYKGKTVASIYHNLDSSKEKQVYRRMKRDLYNNPNVYRTK
jgi:superfamily II DNA or RNA helicase